MQIMDDIFDGIYNDGIVHGRNEGLAIGRNEERERGINFLRDAGYSQEVIDSYINYRNEKLNP